jgi:hypothetical protein
LAVAASSPPPLPPPPTCSSASSSLSLSLRFEAQEEQSQTEATRVPASALVCRSRAPPVEDEVGDPRALRLHARALPRRGDGRPRGLPAAETATAAGRAGR